MSSTTTLARLAGKGEGVVGIDLSAVDAAALVCLGLATSGPMHRGRRVVVLTAKGIAMAKKSA